MLTRLQCMEKGLKTLQAAARTRRTRNASICPTSPGSNDYTDFDDSGLGRDPGSDAERDFGVSSQFPGHQQTYMHQGKSFYQSRFSWPHGNSQDVDPGPEYHNRGSNSRSNFSSNAGGQVARPKTMSQDTYKTVGQPSQQLRFPQPPSSAPLYRPREPFSVDDVQDALEPSSNVSHALRPIDIKTKNALQLYDSPEAHGAPVFSISTLPIVPDFKERPVDAQRLEAPWYTLEDEGVDPQSVQASDRQGFPSYNSPEKRGDPSLSTSSSFVVPDSREHPVLEQQIRALDEMLGDRSVSPMAIQPPERHMQDNSSTPRTTQRPIDEGNFFHQALKLVLRSFEPPLEAGTRRIQWTCVCGFSSFDDFQELYPGAADTYEDSLRMHLGNKQSSTQSTRPHLLNNTLQILRLASIPTHNPSQEQPVLPQHNLHLGTIPTTSPQTSVANGTIFLLLCLPHRRYATKLIQPSLENIRSDRDFFGLLQTSYVSFKGRYRSLLSLKTLRRIKFVHFEMYKSELVDIRVDKGQSVIPPENLKDEYHYRPIPATIIPPIGENHMMHLCSHPEDADSSTAVLMDRVPKKLKDRLYVSSAGTNIGWGIHYVEGWHLSLILLLSFLLLLLASLLFLICWGVLQHDIQGAASVATYVLALIALSIGSLQAAFETELV